MRFVSFQNVQHHRFTFFSDVEEDPSPEKDHIPAFDGFRNSFELGNCAMSGNVSSFLAQE